MICSQTGQLAHHGGVGNSSPQAPASCEYSLPGFVSRDSSAQPGRLTWCPCRHLRFCAWNLSTLPPLHVGTNLRGGNPQLARPTTFRSHMAMYHQVPELLAKTELGRSRSALCNLSQSPFWGGSFPRRRPLEVITPHNRIRLATDEPTAIVTNGFRLFICARSSLHPRSARRTSPPRPSTLIISWALLENTPDRPCLKGVKLNSVSVSRSDLSSFSLLAGFRYCPSALVSSNLDSARGLSRSVAVGSRRIGLCSPSHRRWHQPLL